MANTKTLTKSQFETKFNEALNISKSAAIRFCDSQKMKRGDIARKIDIKYQFVRNVLEMDLAKKNK